MSYHQLNNIQNILLPSNFNFIGANEYDNNVEISKTLHKYLNNAKTEIDIHYLSLIHISEPTRPY